MKYSPFKSKKLITAIADFVFSAVLFFAAQFGTEMLQTIINFLIIGIQPIVFALIADMYQQEQAEFQLSEKLPRQLTKK